MSDTNPPFERLLAHAAWVRRLADSLLSDPNEVDDVVQETWVAALEHSGGESRVRDQRAWLGGVFRNVVRQSRRSAARRWRRENEAARPESLPGTEEIAEQADLQARVIQAVVQLAEPYRSALLMRFFEDLSAEEIGRRLGVPASTVRNRQKRALDLLRERFDREHDGDRRAWCLQLIPIAVPKGAGAAAVALASTTTGVWTMSMQALAVTASVALVGWGSTIAYRGVAADPDPPTVRAQAPAALAADADSAPSVADPVDLADAGPAAPRVEQPAVRQEEGRRPVPVAEPARYVLSGRLVDTAGEPVAGERVFVGGRPAPFPGEVEAGLQLMSELERLREAEARRIRDLKENVEKRDHDRDEAERAENGELEERHPRAEREREEARRGDLQLAERRMADPSGAEYLRGMERPLEGLARWAHAEPDHLESFGAVLGKYVRTDAEGRFELELDEETRLYVTYVDRPGLRRTHVGGWHDLPAEDVTLTVRRIPTARIALWLTDGTTGERIPRWVGVLHRNETPLEDWEAEGRVERVVEVPDGEAPRFSVTVRQPQWAHARVEFDLTPGVRRDVEILVESGPGLLGSVVDAFGQPLPDAFVYWGGAVDIRGNTVFGNYDPERVFGGVETDVTGRFRLPGEADWVTAWHPDHSPVTVRPAEASVIQLAPRGTITGTVPAHMLSGEKRPSALLDRGQRGKVDETGAFSFPDVEAGVHGVSLGEHLFTGLHVGPGETVHVDWDGQLTAAKVELRSGGAPFRGKARAYYVGLDRIFTIGDVGLEAREGRPVVFGVEGQRPGSYVLYTDRQQIAFFELGDTHGAIADMGSADLTVRGAPGRVVYLVPEHLVDNPVVVRIASIFPREVPDSGELLLAPLPAGPYAVYDPQVGIVSHVDVNGTGTELVLP